MKPHLPALLLSLSAAALAQGASPLTLSLSQALVQAVTVAGKTAEKRVPDYVKVRPGDVLAQTVAARNTSARALANVSVRLPVPTGTVYLAADGAAPEGVRTEYSIDGGKTYAPAPLKKKVTVTENGKAVTREVEVRPQEYQAVRWTIAALPAGTAKTLGFRVQVK